MTIEIIAIGNIFSTGGCNYKTEKPAGNLFILCNKVWGLFLRM